jgi:Ca-activated chloride channel family protein
MRFWCWLFLFPTVAMASTENWPRLYNHGVTAYESNDFAQAAASFENATSSQDRALQARALYNLGDTDYRLGQAQPAQAQQLWQRAIKSYESALALDPQDADAKFNRDFVKKKLEELKQQQQQQQQNQKNQQDQQDKKQDQKKDDQQQQQQNQQQNKPDDKQSDQQQQPQQSPDQQKQEQEQQEKAQQQKDKQQKDKQQKEEQQKQEAQQNKPSRPEQASQEKGGQPEDYDKMHATALLDDLRENERNWNFFPEVQMKDLKDSGPPAKDW